MTRQDYYALLRAREVYWRDISMACFTLGAAVGAIVAFALSLGQ